MDKISPSNPFTVRFVAKRGATFLSGFSLFNRSLEKTISPTVTFYDCDYYQEAEVTYDTIKEGEEYNYTITDIDGDEVYKGSFKVTALTGESDGKYKQHSNATEYITR